MYFEARETQSDRLPSRDWVPVGLGTQSGTGTGASLVPIRHYVEVKGWILSDA